MKKLIVFFPVLVLVVVLAGCLAAPQLPPDLCAEYDPSTSHLLKVSTDRGIPLNELYYGLLDATAMGMVFEVVKRERVKKFMVELGEWYDKNYPMSATTLINYMTEQEKAQALSGILSRRISYFKSDLIIGGYDNCMYRAGWNNAMESLFLR